MLSTISPEITNTFNKIIHKENFIKSIKLVLGEKTDVSLAFKIELFNGEITVPEKVFSEAYLDLLALVVFIELNKYYEDKNTTNIIVLDDVFQSVDSPIRKKAMKVIMERLHGWQLFITLHDRMWLESLTSVFRESSEPFTLYEILRWNIEKGPIIKGNIPSDEEFIQIVSNGTTSQIASFASVNLEKISNHLSVLLPISVTRRQGDKYTLGDLWPGIHKVLSKTNIKKISQNINESIYLRNILGGHYNEWSGTISRNEIEEFATNIFDLMNKVYCNKCSFWIQPVNIGTNFSGKWQCRCGDASIMKE